MLSAAASVLQRKAREAFESKRPRTPVAAPVDARAEAALAEAFELRADALREEMFAEDELHESLLCLPRTPAPVAPDAARPALKPKPRVEPARVLCVAAQDID